MSDHSEDLSWTSLWIRLLEAAAPLCESAVPDPSLLGDPQRIECTIWRIVGHATPDAGEAALGRALQPLKSPWGGELRRMCLPAPGPLLAQRDRDTIETWTEGELCAIHALMRGVQDPWWRDRLQSAVDWHLEWTQPDNATNRPWGIHAFLVLGGLEGRMYAETMLHNAQAGGAQADPLVGWALGDAARWLRTGIPLPR